MILTLMLCIGLAIYCLFHGMWLAALLALLGIIPGPGFLPMIACAVTLFAEGSAGWRLCRF